MQHQEILKGIIVQIQQERKSDLVNDYGLLTGLTGSAIFLTEYSKLDNSYSETVEPHIDAIFESIESGFPIETYCAGIAGACLGVNYIYEQLLNDSSFDFVTEEINDFVYKHFLRCLEENNIDFLHGATGIAFYYLKRYEVQDPVAKVAIRQILAHLKQSAIHEENKIKWMQKSGDCDFNISMSHGMSSIIIFLSRLIKLDIDEFNEDAATLLTGATNYVLDQEINYEMYGSYFPNSSKECEYNKSRLAWCYGDLGIAVAIHEASQTLQRKDWEAKAFEVLDFCSTRANLEENLVLDCSICHGTSGLAVIYYYLYLQTQNKKYKTTADYWLEKTIELYEEQKIFFEVSENRYDTSRLSFLEGTIGIGLAILLIKYNIHSSWPEFLLL